MQIYLDAAPIIYLVENVEPYSSQLINRLSKPNIQQVCGELTRLECRVKPMKDGEQVLLAAFDTYFTSIVTTIFPLTRQVIDQATKLRAIYQFKTPDAIHLATAIVSRCDIFLTNDQRLVRCREITVETITS